MYVCKKYSIFYLIKTVICLQTMNHTSNEVKQLLARVCTHLAKTVPQEKMDPGFLKMVLPTLVNGTKEKNSYVKANSEIALITVLRLREGDDTQQVRFFFYSCGKRHISFNSICSCYNLEVLPTTE